MSFERSPSAARDLVHGNANGFTLIELIAVLIILSVLAATIIPRFIDLDVNARLRAIDAPVAELNGREHLQWTNVKLTPGGWTSDTQVWEEVAPPPENEPYLGEEYSWTSTPAPDTTSDGTLIFQGASATLTRTPSQNSRPATWKRNL